MLRVGRKDERCRKFNRFRSSRVSMVLFCGVLFFTLVVLGALSQWFVENVKDLAVKHTELHFLYSGAVVVLGIIVLIAALFAVFKEWVSEKWLVIPTVILTVGWVLSIIAHNTPCCTGG